MKTAGKIFIIASAVLLAAWVLPWLYTLISLKPYSTPFTLYSCTVHDFTSLDRSDGKGFRFIDTEGNVHGDEAQPTFYASVLASKGALPDTIEGRPVTLEEIERNAIIASSDPKDVNRTKPPVYLLMESVPVRLELQDPKEAMVSRKDGIYIYEMARHLHLRNGLQRASEGEIGQPKCRSQGAGFHLPRPPLCRETLPQEGIRRRLAGNRFC